MSRVAIIAKERVNIPLLGEPEIQEKTKQLFNDMKDRIATRFNELREYLHVEPKDEFSNENLLKFFEFNFFYEILGIAADMALTRTDRFNLKENIIASINEENCIEAITGEPMIEAFKDAINSTPVEDAYDRIHRGALIFNLETMDNEENPFAFNQNDIQYALKKDVAFDELLPGFRKSLAKDYEEEMAEEEAYSAKQKCTVKRDDEKAMEFYKDWPNVISPQYQDGKYIGCKHYVEGEKLKEN